MIIIEKIIYLLSANNRETSRIMIEETNLVENYIHVLN